MKNLKEKLAALNWQEATEQINQKGFAILPGLLTNEQCEALINNYEDEQLYRKTVVMERYRFGLGEYKYFKYPLPGIIQTAREEIYPQLAPIANNWMKWLKIDQQFPTEFQQCNKSVMPLIKQNQRR